MGSGATHAERSAQDTHRSLAVNESMIRHPQICDHCGGRFGMVTHRWWGIKFCKKTCKDAYLRELALGRDKIRRWYGFGRRRWFPLRSATVPMPAETT